MDKILNIGWYTRDGDLDYFAKISNAIKIKNIELVNHYVCHTKTEKQRLNNIYDVKPMVLGDFMDKDRTDLDLKNTIIYLGNKYNDVPLRQLIWGDMFELNAPDLILEKRLVLHFKFWEYFIESTKIKIILTEGPGILSTCVLWTVCKKYNVKFLEYSPVGIPGRKNYRSSWDDGIDGLYDMIETVTVDKKSKKYSDAIDYYEKMINNPEKPSYVGIDLNTGQKTQNRSYYSFPKVPRLKIQTNPIKRLINRKRMNNYYLNNIENRYYNWFKSKIKFYYLSNNHLFKKNKKGDKYFLFPLHILNEWSNYPWMGIKYYNICELISEIAACLPLNTKLYVKEHPSLFPQKKISFYRKIYNIPNVVLIDRNEDTFTLISNSESVITLGGTAGWESFIIGKPIISFSNVWYNQLPGVHMVKDEMDLVYILQNISKIKLPSYDEKIKVIYSLYKISFKANHYPTEKNLSEKNIKYCSDALIKYLSKNYLNNKEQTFYE